jgi:hypothetical protein
MMKFIEWLKKHHVIHTWTKWTDVAAGDILLRAELIPGLSEKSEPIKVGAWLRQSRACEICGKRQLHCVESK